MTTVILTKRCSKSLRQVPKAVVAALLFWKQQVEENGITTMQTVQTYRDHGLTGKLKAVGLRSISLSYGHRAYYRVLDGEIEVVQVEDVNNHDYKKIERLFR